jgi:hypothetical protein
MVMTLLVSGKGAQNMTEDLDGKEITPLSDSMLNNVSGGKVIDIISKINAYADDADAAKWLEAYARGLSDYDRYISFLKRRKEKLFAAFDLLEENEKHEFFNYYCRNSTVFEGVSDSW